MYRTPARRARSLAPARALAALLLTLLLPAPSARADACRATAFLESRRAYLGQQVVYRVRILRRSFVTEVDWAEPLTFPSFRAEWLPGRSPDPRIGDVGEHFVVVEERRALFPLRVGVLEVPGAEVRCAWREAGEPRAESVAVAPLRLLVDPLPEPGRPPDFTGVVGRITLSATMARRRARLGETVPLTLTVRGTANVWRAEPALLRYARALPFDVFEAPPRLSFDPGERLGARLSMRLELVPRQPGPTRLPALRVAYFDPELRRYGSAEAPALDLEILPRAPAAAGSAPPATTLPSRESRGAAERGPGRLLPAWGGLALLAALAAAGLLLHRRARSASARRARALARADAAALERELRLALETRIPGASELDARHVLAAAPDADARAAAELLLALERARFGAPSSAPPSPRAEEVQRLLARLRSR